MPQHVLLQRVEAKVSEEFHSSSVLAEGKLDIGNFRGFCPSNMALSCKILPAGQGGDAGKETSQSEATPNNTNKNAQNNRGRTNNTRQRPRHTRNTTYHVISLRNIFR
jgi:hypothetical protein